MAAGLTAEMKAEAEREAQYTRQLRTELAQARLESASARRDASEAREAARRSEQVRLSASNLAPYTPLGLQPRPALASASPTDR